VKGKKSRRWLWLLVLVMVVVVGIVVGRQIVNRGAQAAQPEEGQMVTAFIGDLSAKASASGQLVPQREATLALGISGRVADVFVKPGDKVAAGDLLAQLEADGLQRAVRSAEQALAIQEANLAELEEEAAAEDFAAAEAAVTSAQAQLDALLEGPSDEEVAATEANLRAAEASVWAAAEQRDQVAAGATAAEIAAAEAQLIQAELQFRQARDAHDATMRCFTTPAGDEVCPGLGPFEEQTRYTMAAAEKNLESAQAALDRLLAGADENQLGAANANVSAAAAQRDAAQAQLDLLLVPSSEAQLASARAQLAQAEANLAALSAGASEQRVAIAQAQVEQAVISLEEALDNLANTSLVAPFDAVVTAVYVEVGEFASGPAVDLVDTESMEVVLDVDEVDIGAISLGQEAVVTLETWPDEELTAEVVSIAPQATAMAEIVTYQVHLRIEAGSLPLRAGMTANAELVTAQREGVLLVPNRAITADRGTGTYTVNRLEGDTVSEVQVSIGLRDNRYTEIRGGLAEGDQVIIGEYEEVLDFSQGPPSAVRNMRP
jgi:HlyD family secretion protein